MRMSRTTWILSAVLVLGLSMPAAAAIYEQDFEGVPNGAAGTDLGDGSEIADNSPPLPDGFEGPVAGVFDGKLRLTSDLVGSTLGNFRIPSLGADGVDSWIASFELTLRDSVGNNNPADGFSFNWGNIPSGVGGSEEGFGNQGVLSFEFDTWDNGGGEAPAHNIAVDQVDALTGFSDVPPLVDGEVRENVPVVLTWTRSGPTSGSASIIVDGTPILSGVAVSGFAAEATHTFAISGRTGGATEDLIFDNFRIEGPIPPASDFNEDGVVDSLDFDILANNFLTAGNRTVGDTDFNFFVDMKDFGNFLGDFNAAGAANVPEPTTGVLALLGVLGFLVIGRKARR